MKFNTLNLNYLGENIKVITYGTSTMVELSDGSTAESILMKDDIYNQATGIYIAFYKAKIKSDPRNQALYQEKITPFMGD